MTEDELIEKAKQARQYAYAPYSNFRVGAAIATENGIIFTGVNVENSSFGLTICAERNAIASGISQGIRNFKMIAIFSESSPPATPCGACRQVLYEFAPDLAVICANNKGEILRYRLSDLLPDGFGFSSELPND